MSAVLTHEYEPHGELVPTMAEQARRETRAAEIMLERLSNLERVDFLCKDCMDSGELSDRIPVMLMKLPAAKKGNQFAIAEIIAELEKIQAKVERCADVMWSDECETLATMEAV